MVHANPVRGVPPLTPPPGYTPPASSPRDVYAADRAGKLSPVVRHDPARVYVPTRRATRST